MRRRAKRDGLPFRLYERKGKRVYSIGYKGEDNKWAFRLSCPVADRTQITLLRAEAIARAGQLALRRPASDTFSGLAAAWLKHQNDIPLDQPERRTELTLRENKRELAMLELAFGHMKVREMLKTDAYAYLDACLKAKDPVTGKAKPRPAKANKEIALARTVLEYGVRIGMLEANPFAEVKKLKTKRTDRYVTQYEMDVATRVGAELGGTSQIVALALKTAWLCVRRSVEVRGLTRDQLKETGIEWIGAKAPNGTPPKKALIEWSDDLRVTIDAALGVPRNKLAGDWYVFGNLQGQRYTKGGWKANLARLMRRCVAVAKREGKPFQPFSLQDCRPMGITDKMEQGHTDVQNATLHTDSRMVATVYDRRAVKKARPVK